ncbi:hypothetical protein AG0111_0g2418 [Alternaria gaisen]|uniref:Uncharacterized protein n=1 Tax=Alternaria gaisen TaxID=167740 RepID=A0ACB6G4Q3_9PLEO|nr:hypothetical protein AG0111_0g2418 [Alternaria gaisen]
MHTPKPTEPRIPDCYFDLGVNRCATAADVKKAFDMLARRHHTDKIAPGKTIDAVEFRQAYEAFEVLRDSTTRSEYDTRYNKRRKQLQKKAEKKKMMIEKKKEQKRVEKRKKMEEKKAERKGKSK